MALTNQSGLKYLGLCLASPSPSTSAPSLPTTPYSSWVRPISDAQGSNAEPILASVPEPAVENPWLLF